MDKNETAEVHYSLGVQIISYIGVPALTLLGLWCVSRPVWEQGLTTAQIIISPVAGVAVLYQCAKGWRVLRYLRVRMFASADQLEIRSGSSRRVIPWEEFSPPSEYPFERVIRLSLKSGEVVLYAFDNMKNIDVVKEMIRRSND